MPYYLLSYWQNLFRDLMVVFFIFLVPHSWMRTNLSGLGRWAKIICANSFGVFFLFLGSGGAGVWLRSLKKSNLDFRMKIKKKTLYITSPNLVVYRRRGAERARGTELDAGGQFFSAWFSFFIGTTVLWASLLALSFSWPNLYSRYKVWLCPSGSPSWSSRLLVEKQHSDLYWGCL